MIATSLIQNDRAERTRRVILAERDAAHLLVGVAATRKPAEMARAGDRSLAEIARERLGDEAATEPESQTKLHRMFLQNVEGDRTTAGETG